MSTNTAGWGQVSSVFTVVLTAALWILVGSTPGPSTYPKVLDESHVPTNPFGAVQIDNETPNVMAESKQQPCESCLEEDVQRKRRDKLCDVDRYSASGLSVAEFRSKYAGRQPVVIVDDSHRNEPYAAKVARERLIVAHRDIQVTLSSANSYSHEKRFTTMGDYIENYVHRQASNASGGESWYLFGDHNSDEWQQFFNTDGLLDPTEPGFIIPKYAGPINSLSFGIGGLFSGVPFHIHGGGFSEMFHGGKLWMLYPPGTKIPYVTPSPSHWPYVLEENYSILQWMLEVYPRLHPQGTSSGPQRPLECMLEKGELLYFPTNWSHAILNVGEYNAFMTTFTDGEMKGGPAPAKPRPDQRGRTEL